MSEFKAIETQEELDTIIKARLNRLKEQYADYDELKSRVSTLEAENAGLKETVAQSNQTAADFESQIEGYKSTIAGYETAKTKTAIALKYGLPFEFADQLQGEDEASLTADAERFASLMKPQTPFPPLKSIEPEVKGEDAVWRDVIKDLNKGE
ncbi:TPA: phage scaffold protein [Streptococcus suis]